jgi:adenylate cyclase, class 2
LTEPRRNIELKARDSDPEQSLAACESLGADDHGVLVQRDTYFNVIHGRLKLREQEGDAPRLIAYERADQTEQRESRYRIVEVVDPEGVKVALSAALGVRIIVAKRRRLFLWKSVRIHLDHVVGLGDFIEFEAVAPTDSDLSHERDEVSALRGEFKIDDGALIGVSYSDLALGASTV